MKTRALLLILCLFIGGCATSRVGRPGDRQIVTVRPDVTKAQATVTATRKGVASARRHVESAKSGTARAEAIASKIEAEGTAANSQEARQLRLEVEAIGTELLAVSTNLGEREEELIGVSTELADVKAKEEARDREMLDFQRDRNNLSTELSKAQAEIITKDAKIKELRTWMWRGGLATISLVAIIAGYVYLKSGTLFLAILLGGVVSSGYEHNTQVCDNPEVPINEYRGGASRGDAPEQREPQGVFQTQLAVLSGPCDSTPARS